MTGEGDDSVDRVDPFAHSTEFFGFGVTRSPVTRRFIIRLSHAYESVVVSVKHHVTGWKHLSFRAAPPIEQLTPFDVTEKPEGVRRGCEFVHHLTRDASARGNYPH